MISFLLIFDPAPIKIWTFSYDYNHYAIVTSNKINDNFFDLQGFPGGSDGKESTFNVGDLG